VLVLDEQFDQPDAGWFFAGNAGYDFNKGLAHFGPNNAWVRASSGWNALNRFQDVEADTDYEVGAWLRLSDSLTDGYFSVRAAPELNGEGQIITERKLAGPNPSNPSQDNYNRYVLRFNSNGWRRILVYIGLWGVGKDAWIQIDDVKISNSRVRFD
jgi:hypothetical protein